MDVIGHNADFDDAGALSLRFAEEKRQQKLGDRLVDERESRPAGPRQVGVNAHRHIEGYRRSRAIP